MQERITIERAENGFMIRAFDPVQAAENEKSDGKYKSPYKEYVFNTRDAAMEWVTENMDRVLPKVQDAYNDAFNAEVKEG